MKTAEQIKEFVENSLKERRQKMDEHDTDYWIYLGESNLCTEILEFIDSEDKPHIDGFEEGTKVLLRHPTDPSKSGIYELKHIIVAKEKEEVLEFIDSEDKP